MNDRELLELAARAAEYEYAKYGGYIVVDGIPGNWNPITDDGDALRLAVKLDLHIRFYRKHVDVDTDVCLGDIISETFTTDKGAAARRAIVRAAAEIGKQRNSHE